MTSKIKARFKYRGARERRQERTSTPLWRAGRALFRCVAALTALARRLEAHRGNRKQ